MKIFNVLIEFIYIVITFGATTLWLFFNIDGLLIVILSVFGLGGMIKDRYFPDVSWLIYNLILAGIVIAYFSVRTVLLINGGYYNLEEIVK